MSARTTAAVGTGVLLAAVAWRLVRRRRASGGAAGPEAAGRAWVDASRPAQAAAVAAMAITAWYLWWRVTETIDVGAFYIAFPLLFADILGAFFFVLFAANLWALQRREPPPPPEGLSVDVFIPTYNEPLSVLRPTIAAAVAMEYPHRTYVLDDGRREEVRALCEELGAEYLTRPTNTHAKAGNINEALKKTSGEFIAFFDADHAPFPHFLVRLLGYFRDPKVALVQAPQVYYNLDSFQHERARSSREHSPWHEQSVFYDAILPGKDRWNAVFWCGSTAIIRRRALEKIGGVDTRTVTEDMHTTMSIHARGWKSVYHNEELAVGIAPDDLEAFLVQRLRWAQGAVQILRSDNPLLRRGLTWRQRIAYFTSVAYVLEYVPKLIYLVTPIEALLFGVLPMRTSGEELLWHFLPYYVSGVVATRLLSRGTLPYFPSQRFHFLKLGIMLRALTALVYPRRLKFKVTPKVGDAAQPLYLELRHLKLQIGLGVASALAAGWAVGWWAAGAEWQLQGAGLWVTVGWALFNGWLALSAVRWATRRPHRREMYRFPFEAPVIARFEGVDIIGRSVDLSAGGIAWRAGVPLPVGAQGTVTILLPDGDRLQLPVEVRSLRRDREGRSIIGGRFLPMENGIRKQLVLLLFQQVALAHVRGTEPTPAPVAGGVPAVAKAS
ncbi:Cellulose synthase 1 [bacterium HR29]|nr:Cellulose synthase 1 [bacterium HR29]